MLIRIVRFWRSAWDVLPWVRFCLKAHFFQAATLIRRNEEYELLFDGVSKIIERHKLHERSAVPLFDAALGMTITNAWYRRDAEIGELTASRDLKRLADLELIEPHGERRGRNYTGGKVLRELRESTRKDKAPYADPYDIVKDKAARDLLLKLEPRLPGL